MLTEASVENRKTLFEKEPQDSMISQFYASGLDTARRDSEGMSPIKELLEKVASITDMASMWKVVTPFHLEDFIQPFFVFEVAPDASEHPVFRATLEPPRLGLGEPFDYGSNLTDKPAHRDSYRGYIENLLVLAGQSKEESKKQAIDIFKFEKEMADIQMLIRSEVKPGILQNKTPQPKPVKLSELKNLAKNIDFETVFRGMGINDDVGILIERPVFHN